MAALGRTGRVGLVLAALFVVLAVVLAVREGLESGDAVERGGGSVDADARRHGAAEDDPTLQGRAEPVPDEAATVDLEAVDRERDLHGVVVDEAGAPIGGARLAVVTERFEPVPLPRPSGRERRLDLGPETWSAADGTFALRLSRGWRCDLLVEKEGFARLTLAWVQAGERLRVVLTPGVSLIATVVGEDGRVQPGVRVELTRVSAYGDVTIDRRGPADADGRVLFEHLPPGVDAHLNAYPPDGGWPAYAGVTLPEEGRVERELTLRAGEELRGRVTDARTGEPIPGARVGKSMRLVGAVETDEDGRWVIPQWRSRGYKCLHVLAEGYARMQRRVRGSADLDFALLPERAVIGTVVAYRGSLVNGARISAVASVLSAGFVHEVSTASVLADLTGRFRLGQLRRDLRHLLVVTAPGYGRTLRWFGPLGDADEPLDLGQIEIHEAHLLAGRVVNAEGAPSVRTSVGIRGPILEDEVRPPAMGPPRYGERVWRNTDDLGRFAFPDVAPGAYELTVRPTGGTPHKQRVVVAIAPRRHDLEIELPATGAYRVVVEGVDGTPLAGVRVYLHVVGGPQVISALTDEAGVAAFASAAPAAAVRITVLPDEAKRYAAPGRVDWPEDSREMRLALPLVVVASGRAVDAGGRPLARTEVVVERDGKAVHSTWTGTDGAFRVRLRSPAPYDLVLTGRKPAPMPDGRTRLVLQPFEGRRHVAVPDGRPTELVAQPLPANRELRIRALAPDGEPVPGATVSFLGARPASLSATITTDDAGRARLTGLDARPLTIWIQPPEESGWKTAKHPGLVADGRELVVRFE